MKVFARDLSIPRFTCFVAGRPVDGRWDVLGFGETFEAAAAHCSREGDFVARQRISLSFDLPDDPKDFHTFWRWQQRGEPRVELEPLPWGTCDVAAAS